MTDSRLDRSLLYRSLVSGEPLTLRSARLATVSREDLAPGPKFRGRVEYTDLSDPRDIESIEAINIFYWDCLEQDVFGKTYRIMECENYLARPLPDEPDAVDTDSNDPKCHGIAGHVALNAEPDGFLHIVVFNVWPQWHGRGVGHALLKKAIEVAKSLSLPSIRLGTTNDNLPALYFYQRAGFVIDNIIVGEMIGPHGFTMPGFAGIPVRDEIRLRLDL